MYATDAGAGSPPRARLVRELLAAGDARDALHPARGLHDPLEVREVLDLHQRGAGDATVDRPQLERLDVGPRRADRRREIGVEPLPVLPLDREADEEALPRGLLPVDLEPPLRLVDEEEQVGQSNRWMLTPRPRVT